MIIPMSMIILKIILMIILFAELVNNVLDGAYMSTGVADLAATIAAVEMEYVNCLF